MITTGSALGELHDHWAVVKALFTAASPLISPQQGQRGQGVLSPSSECGGTGSPSDLHCTVGAGLISRGVQIKVLAPHLASPDTSLAGEGPPHYAP